MAKTKALDNMTIAATVATCRTKAEAAERLQIDAKTLYTYLQNYEIQAAIAAMKQDAAQALLQAFTEARAGALTFLQSVLTDAEAKTADKIKAAEIILTAGRAAELDARAADLQTAEMLSSAESKEDSRTGRITFHNGL